MRLLASLLMFLMMGCSAPVAISHSSKFIPPAIPSDLIRVLPKESGPGPDRFAVILGLNTEDRHRGNISLAYQVLVETGVRPKNIFILDIASTTPIFPKTDTTSFASVRLLLQRLSEVVDPRDEVIVYVTGHGRLIENDPHLVLNPSEFMASREFLASLEMIHPGRGLVLFDQCYWSIEFHPKSCEWTTITVARPGLESSGSMFPRQFFYALRRGVTDISKAFAIARGLDKNTFSGENDPQIIPRTCGVANSDDDVLKF